MNILFITGNEANHNYLTSSIIDKLPNVDYKILKIYSGLSDLEYYSRIYGKTEITSVEKKYLTDFIFSRNDGINDFNCLKLPDEIVIKNISDFNPTLRNITSSYDYDYVICYGAPIIKDESIMMPDTKSINLHFGLSRFYRGSDTNIYALAKNRLNEIGLTAHKIIRKIDGGKVLFEIIPTKNDLKSIRTINELNIFLLKKAIIKIVAILKDEGFKYKNEGYNGELVLDKSISIEHIIDAENNLKKNSIKH